jgi:hypothetical protein
LDQLSTHAPSSAIRTGSWNGISITNEPMRIFSVRAAIAAIAVITDGL